jgi:hypothetical protein
MAHAEVISLTEYRARRHRAQASLERLDRAVGRLDPLVGGQRQHLTPSVERELTRIAAAVSGGLAHEAADRAERLADLLEHPAAHG